MPYEYAAIIPYGITGRTGTMTASLRDLALAPVVPQPAFTLTEGAGGLYHLYTAGMPDGHRGAVQVLDSLLPTWSYLETVMPPPNLLGSGRYSVTVTLQTPAALPITGASVTIQNAAGTAIQEWGITNSLGQVTFALDAATYRVVIGAGPGYTPLVPQVLVVVGATAVTYVLTPQAGAPSPPFGGLCTVRFYVTESRTPKAGYTVLARLVEENNALDDELLSRTVAAGVTDVGGIVDLPLVQRGQFLKGGARKGVYEIFVTAPDGTLTHHYRGRVPNTLTANAEDLIPE